MIKTLSIYAALLGVLLLSSLLHTQDSQSTVFVTPPDSYRNTCISSYFRVLPHYCGNTTTPQVPFALTLDNTCRSFSIGSIPSTANNLSVNLAVTISSTNAVGKKGITFTQYQESSCTLVNKVVEFSIDEMAARAANTPLQVFSTEMSMATFSSNVYYKGVIIAGGALTGIQANIVGYFD